MPGTRVARWHRRGRLRPHDAAAALPRHLCGWSLCAPGCERGAPWASCLLTRWHPSEQLRRAHHGRRVVSANASHRSPRRQRRQRCMHMRAPSLIISSVTSTVSEHLRQPTDKWESCSARAGGAVRRPSVRQAPRATAQRHCAPHVVRSGGGGGAGRSIMLRPVVTLGTHVSVTAGRRSAQSAMCEGRVGVICACRCPLSMQSDVGCGGAGHAAGVGLILVLDAAAHYFGKGRCCGRPCVRASTSEASRHERRGHETFVLGRCLPAGTTVAVRVPQNGMQRPDAGSRGCGG